MKLLFLEPNPEFGGGMEAVSLRLAKGLARRGHDISLVHSNDGDMLPIYKSFCSNIIKTNLTGFRKREPIRTIRMILKLHSEIRRHSFVSVFTSHLGYLTIGAVLKWMNGIPWHYHLGLPGTGRNAFDRRALYHLGSGISPAAHTLQTWKEAGWPEESLWEVRNWIDGDDFRQVEDRAELRSHLGIPQDAFCIGFIGRIISEKGVEILIDAVNAFDVDDAFLLMVGRSGPEYAEALRRRCTRPGKFLMIPKTSRPENIFAVSDVVCAPSIATESYPLVVLEAMVTGTPVICSDVGILPDMLGEEFSDLVAKKGSIASLLGRLEHIYATRKDFTKRSQALRQRALEQYGPDEPVSNYERIIRESVGAIASSA